MNKRGDKGFMIMGSDSWCVAIDRETGDTFVFGEDEIDRVRSLCMRLNNQLAESLDRKEPIELRIKAREAAEDCRQALIWMYQNKSQLKERPNKKEITQYKAEDMFLLIEETEKKCSVDTRLLINSLFSPMEKAAFILMKVWGVKILELPSIMGISEGRAMDLSSRINKKSKEKRNKMGAIALKKQHYK